MLVASSGLMFDPTFEFFVTKVLSEISFTIWIVTIRTKATQELLSGQRPYKSYYQEKGHTRVTIRTKAIQELLSGQRPYKSSYQDKGQTSDNRELVQ